MDGLKDMKGILNRINDGVVLLLVVSSVGNIPSEG